MFQSAGRDGRRWRRKTLSSFVRGARCPPPWERQWASRLQAFVSGVGGMAAYQPTSFPRAFGETAWPLLYMGVATAYVMWVWTGWINVRDSPFPRLARWMNSSGRIAKMCLVMAGRPRGCLSNTGPEPNNISSRLAILLYAHFCTFYCSDRRKQGCKSAKHYCKQKRNWFFLVKFADLQISRICSY